MKKQIFLAMYENGEHEISFDTENACRDFCVDNDGYCWREVTLHQQANEQSEATSNCTMHGVRGCFYSQDNVIEILENAHDLKDAIAIIKEGNDGDNNP